MIIGIFTDTYPPDLNGVATASKILRDVLIAHGHRVVVITTGLKGQKKMTFEDDILRIPGITLRALYSYRMTSFFNRKAFQIIKKIPFDIFHVQTDFGVAFFGRICAKKLDVPLVYTYHTSYEDYSTYIAKSKWANFIAKRIIVSLIRTIINNQGEIITPSDKTKKQLNSYHIKKYVNVVPNALNLDQYEMKRDIDKEKAFRKKYHLEEKRILLSLGRIAKEKNVEELLQGFEQFKIQTKDQKTVLLVVGGGPSEEALHKLRNKLQSRNDIILFGKVPHEDTSFFYQISECFLSASKTETQGLTFSEAIENGALILSQYDFNLEQLIQDGITGFYYDDLDSFSKKLQEILSLSLEEKEKIKNNAKRRNSYLFNTEKYYERILHVYKKAIRSQF